MVVSKLKRFQNNLTIDHSNLSVEISEKIAVVKIDNPPGNCLSDEVLNLLDQKFEEFNLDPMVKVIILTGGERCFSTDADINQMDIESSCVGELYDMHDLVEGVHAYLEKRKPDFLDP